MSDRWQPGDPVVVRGVVHGLVWIAHPMTVVKDAPERVILLLQPGAECRIPAGLIERKYSGETDGNMSRWDEQQNPPWTTREWIWNTRRFLIFKEPAAYFAEALVWHHESDEFLGWYVNFEMPFIRRPIGFDTLDLELDLEVSPAYDYQWKDNVEYEEGVRRGAISPVAAQQVEMARRRVLERVQKRIIPFDSTWVNWKPEPEWRVPPLHKEWNRVWQS